MTEQITLDNIHTFTIPLSEHSLKWKFEDESGQLSEEFKDQIIPLTSEASIFLWNFQNTQKYLGAIPTMGKYYKEWREFSFGEHDSQKVKKWLFEREIPFDRKVFWVTQPQWGFILTWKMVIKFSDDIFLGSNELIWDRTLNWALIYDHNDVFYFGKNRIFDAKKHSEEMDGLNRLIKEIQQGSINK